MAAAEKKLPTILSPTRTQDWGPSTNCVHANRIENPYHAVAQPIVQSATFSFRDSDDLREFMQARVWGDGGGGRVEYGRYGNPTVTAVEQRMAGLEGAGDALLFSSGMAAVTTVLLAMLPTGAHIVITHDCYRRTREFCNTFLARLGIQATVVQMGDYDSMEAAIQDNTRLLVSETPTNPYLRVLDLARFAAIARKHGVKSLVDSTFATPYNLRPLDYGIDLVAHSATKYLGGHNDLLAGVIAGEAGLISSLKNSLNVMGAVSDPHNAGLLLRGLKTLALRIERQNQSGLAVAQYLEGHPKVERVWYPGLPCHPEYEVARQQMKGFGGVVDALRIPQIAPSLGGVETLVEQPALISYFEYSTEEREKVGISDNLVRLSLGIEDTEDLIADLEQALERVK
jgi:cystathionine gamma-synthase